MMITLPGNTCQTRAKNCSFHNILLHSPASGAKIKARSGLASWAGFTASEIGCRAGI